MARNFVRASSQYLTPPDFLWGTLITVGVWVRFTALPTSGQTFGIESYGPASSAIYNRLFCVTNNAGTIEFRFQFTVGASTQIYKCTPSFSTDVWYHLAVSANATTNPDTILLFVDGVSQTVTQTGGLTNNAPGYTGAGNTAIARWESGATHYWDGDMGHAFAIEGAMTEDEIKGIGKGVSVLKYYAKYRSVWQYYFPLIGHDSPELSPTGQSATVTGATKADSHPPVLQVGLLSGWKPTVVLGAGIEIDGDEVDFQEYTLSTDASINQRTTASMVIRSMDGSYTPDPFAELSVTVNGSLEFAGLIEDVVTSGMKGANTTSAGLDHRVTASDFSGYFDRRTFTGTLTAGTLKAQLTQLLADSDLDDVGFTLDPAQVDGPDMEEKTYTSVYVRQILDTLSDATNDGANPRYIYRVSVDKVLSMIQLGTESAPIAVSTPDTNVRGDIRVQRRGVQGYANRIIVKAGKGTKYDITETFTGDGVEDTFPLRYTFSYGRGFITVDGINESFDARPTDTGTGDWELLTATNEIFRSTGAVGNGDPIVIIYDGALPYIAQADDAGEQTLRGLIERIVIKEDLTDADEADLLATSLLAEATLLPKTVTFKTTRRGINPGMTMSITCAPRDLSGSFTVTRVAMQHLGRNIFERTITLAGGAITQQQWIQFWKELAA